MCQTLNFKSESKVLASIRIINRHTNRTLVPVLHENTVRFVGSENGEIYFEVMKQTEFDLTIDILNINNDKINEINLLRPFEKIIERNKVLGCSMILEEYIIDKGQPLTFNDERSRYLGEIKVGFDRVFATTFSWEVDYYWIPQTFGNFRTVCRKETDSGGIIFDTTRALLKPGRSLEQVRFKEATTSQKFYAYIRFWNAFPIIFNSSELLKILSQLYYSWPQPPIWRGWV